MHWIQETFETSEQRSCRIAGLSRSAFRYELQRPDGPYIKLWGLNIKRKAKRRLPPRQRAPLTQPDAPNHTWSLDFMSDSLSSGRKFRVFNVLDDFNREALAIEVNTSIPAAYVIRVLERIIFFRSKPQKIRVDNGPEFIAKDFLDWCKSQEIEIIHIQPGKPMQNAYIERFNGSFRRDILDAYWFKELDEVRQYAENWRIDYNLKRPHDTLNNMSPIAFAAHMFSKTKAKA